MNVFYKYVKSALKINIKRDILVKKIKVEALSFGY